MSKITTKKLNYIITGVILAVALIYTCITGVTFYRFSNYDPWFYTENGVTEVQELVQYSPNLKGTMGGGTKIYVKMGPDAAALCAGKTQEEKYEIIKKLPSALILGGTHPNEPSSQVTAALLLETLEPKDDTVIFIVTETNRSAFSHSHPQEASPMYYQIKTQDGGVRTFKFGSRATNTNQQWPNPDIYTNQFGGKLSNMETRNLNRAYPGLINGTYTEKVAYGITELIRKNDIKVTIDMHEASPEYITINAMVSHQTAAPIGALAGIMMEMDGVKIGTEKSPETLHGLTHRELGDNTYTFAFLAETSNASQGKLRGAFTEELITYEKPDKFYEKAWELTTEENKLLYGQCVPINVRVARHTSLVASLLTAYNAEYDSNFSDIEFKDPKTGEYKYGLKGYEGDRQADLLACGKLSFHIDLASLVLEADEADLAEFLALNGDPDMESYVSYNMILNKGVGYFLQSEPEDYAKRG